MEALLEEIMCSVEIPELQCKLTATELQDVEVNVGSVVENLERSKGARESKKSIKVYNEFGVEETMLQEDARKLFDSAQHSIKTISGLRSGGALNVSHVSKNIFQVEMHVDGRPVSFQVRCDAETNRFSGVESQPPIDKIKKIGNLWDLEEIIRMMSSAFKDHFSETIPK